jgi:hypothetical protein
MEDQLYSLGSYKHLFTDWMLVEPGYGVAWAAEIPGAWEMPHGVTIIAHRPRVETEPFLRQDQPWESSVAQPSLIQDDGLFRAYYRVQAGENRHQPSGSMLAYAESNDGLTWTKPNLGLIEFDGSTDNNFVYGMDIALGRSIFTGSVFKDSNPDAPDDERYKMVYRAPDPERRESIFGAVSPDGIHWRTLEEPLIPGYFSDTLNVVEFDPRRGKYVGYFRGWTSILPGKLHGRRTIAYSETDDFKHWPNPETVVSTGMNDGADSDIYTNSYTQIPGADAYVMLPAFYQRNIDVMEIHMMLSRDGVNWERPIQGPIIPRGEPGSAGMGSMSVGKGMISNSPGEWSIPISLRSGLHNESHYQSKDPKPASDVYFATWREDGFTSLDAESYGEFTTIPFTFDGSHLKINAWTRFGGDISVEVADPYGEEMGRFVDGKVAVNASTLEGKTFADCDPITGDNLERIVTWRGDSDLSSWQGKPIRLRFRMRRARLYSLRFV